MAITLTPTTADVVDTAAAIGQAKQLVNTAVTSVTQDGQTTAFDQQMARKRLRELEDQQAAEDGTRKKRPVMVTVDLR